MLITEKNCTGRIGTLVTDLKIEASARNEKERCLNKAGFESNKCVDHCVNDALKLKLNIDIIKEIIMTKKLKVSVISGALLGIFCIIGGGIRMGYSGNELYLFALWYNRLIMGILIGLSKMDTGINGLLKGGFLGLIVSLAFYLSTGMNDLVSFLAGIIYGVIIVAAARKYE
jgi:hypothetical protein